MILLCESGIEGGEPLGSWLKVFSAPSGSTIVTNTVILEFIPEHLALLAKQEQHSDYFLKHIFLRVILLPNSKFYEEFAPQCKGACDF